MKRNWLLYLVMFSLALNFGTIGTLVYLRIQDRPGAVVREGPPPPMPLREMWGCLNLAPEQRQTLRRLFPEHRTRVRDMREALGKRRHELFEMVKTGIEPGPPLQAKIREISDLQGRLEEEVVKFLLETRKQLTPDQQTAFAQLMERQMPPFPGGPGRGWGPGGPRGSWGGWDRDRGMDCPMPPPTMPPPLGKN